MSKPKRIYLAGPMSGMPAHNMPAFHAAAEALSRLGWEVVNPADNFGGRTDLPRSSYLRADLALLLQCDALAMLPGWQRSVGAALEYLVARQLELPVFDAVTMKSIQPMRSLPPQRKGILEEANQLTAGDRNTDYGDPTDDFTRTARMWTAILADRLRPDTMITAMDVPLCMIAVKLARQVHRHKRDNLVDIAGYARTAAMVAGEE